MRRSPPPEGSPDNLYLVRFEALIYTQSEGKKRPGRIGSQNPNRRLTLASFDTTGLAGNSTGGARRMVSLRSMASCDWSSPNGRFPYSIWYRITPAAHTSTLDEISGGWEPRSKHSGGRYLGTGVRKFRRELAALPSFGFQVSENCRKCAFETVKKHSGQRHLRNGLKREQRLKHS